MIGVDMDTRVNSIWINIKCQQEYPFDEWNEWRMNVMGGSSESSE
jgi:hypothetical protein